MTHFRIALILVASAAIALAAAIPACLAPESVTCGDDGPTCPPGWICTLDNKQCIDPELTLCGDGNVDEGEDCDDGNLVNNDGCNFDCRVSGCGDGFLAEGEFCDDGNTTNGDGCDRTCSFPETCGDGERQNYTVTFADGTSKVAEACDGGGEDTAECNADCTLARCGDGQVNAAADEQCDGGDPLDPLAVDTPTCNKDCTVNACGDGKINPMAGEQCDNGLYCIDGSACTSDDNCAGLVGDSTCQTRDFDCCTRTCFNPLCGNGVWEPMCEGFPLEKCDDGRHCANLTPCVSDAQCAGQADSACITRRATGCRQDCQSPEICGDGVVNNYEPYNEVCDDGRHCADLTTQCENNDDCSAVEGITDFTCRVRNGTGCSAACDSLEVCGDGKLNNYDRVDAQGVRIENREVCDDGRQCFDGTPCTTAAMCAGVTGGDVECRARNADGCSADCLSDESCGDGYLNNYLHEMVNDQQVCVPRGQSCPVDFATLMTVGVPFMAKEACDDGNNLDNDGCTADCLSEEECGDGYVNDYANDALDELCDDGNNTAGDGCAPDCRSTENCGNRVVDPGEECDDGPDNGTEQSANNCSLQCRFVACGNARKDPGEQCDEAVLDMNGDVVTPNADDLRCNEECVCNVCGDTDVNTTTGSTTDCPISRFEECDDGGVDTDMCDRNCTFPVCGDTLVNFPAGELCDNGPGAVAGETAESANCNVDCTQAFCGDGKLNRAKGEVCDDNNNVSGDGCSADCLSEEVCGDDILNAYVVTRSGGGTSPAEVCDDGRFCDDAPTNTPCTEDGDCVGLGDEVCATRDATGCSDDCLSKEVCGDSYLNFNEACDDGNDDPGDGCGTSCQIESGFTCPTLGAPCLATCNDLEVVGNETCDDGNNDAGDGCSPTCRVEPGSTCPTANATGGPCTPDCGDILIRQGETCDDGNIDSGDGCDSTCMTEAGYTCQGVSGGLGGGCTAICNDGLVRRGETCDDTNNDAGDGCSATCQQELGYDCPPATAEGVGGACVAVCGDFITRGDEECDDGNDDPGDGCDANCMRESGFSCPGGTVETVGGACTPICGDGLLRTTESCDDNNTNSGDGCDSACKTEPGYTCPSSGGVGGTCAPTCGDGLIRGNETCDESTTTNSAGCVSCQAQPGFNCPTAAGNGGTCTNICGDNMVVAGEECDEGSANANTGSCTAGCLDATCSDNFRNIPASGAESDVDCGGGCPQDCENDDMCVTNNDCVSLYCNPVGRVCETAPPVSANDDTVVMLETDAMLAIDVATELTANDMNFDSATFATMTPSCGSIGGDTMTVTFTPPADLSTCANSEATFDYEVCSSFNASVCDTATVTVDINRLPTLADAFICVPVPTTRVSVDVATLFTDPDSDGVAMVTATTTDDGLASVVGTVATFAPDDRDLADIYAVTLGACDDSEAPGCTSSDWTVVLNDKPTLADLTTPTDVTINESAPPVAFATIITSTGVSGAQGADPIVASVLVGASAGGPFAAMATTSFGSCAADSGAETVTYTAGGAPGDDSCFIQVCETCNGGAVCSVTEYVINVDNCRDTAATGGTDSGCMGGTPTCNTAENGGDGRCEECLETGDCASGFCNTVSDPNTCVECLSGVQCVGDPQGTACNNNICGCDAANDCNGPNAAGPACDGGTCGGDCAANNDCNGTPATPICDTGSFSCVECTMSSQCADNPNGDVCGAETANVCGCDVDVDCDDDDATGPACQSGGICGGECGDSADCTADPALPACNTTSDTCVECTVDGECAANADGAQCGAATANVCGCDASADCDSGAGATGDVCDVPSGVCVVCTDAEGCGAGEVCNPAGTMCVECNDDDDCTTNPDGDACGAATASMCGCVDASDCGDGAATGNACVSNACADCTNDTDCVGSAAGGFCNTSGVCAAPTCSDGAMNGDETGVDCGGTGAGCLACDGEACTANGECQSGNCDVGGTNQCLAAPTCSDGIMNGDETGVDCGGTGAGCLACDGEACAANGECQSGNCDVGGTDLCLAPTCSDGIMNGDETGVDCGGTGAGCLACDGEACAANGECQNGSCDVGGTDLCLAPTCSDGVMNGDETGVDCGGTGAGCLACDGDACTVDGDCQSDNCDTLVCTAAPTCSDGIMNGDETGVDCGGTGAGCLACDGDACTVDGDCQSDNCDTLVCTAAPTCSDGIMNGDETGVDCGGTGAGCLACDGEACAANGECQSGSCDVGGTDLCLAPTCSDGIMNGDETGVDCGVSGGTCLLCDGEGCTVNGDCQSDNCDTVTTNSCVP